MRYLVDRYLSTKNLILVGLDVLVLAGTTCLAVWLRLGLPVSYTLSPQGYRYPILLIIAVHMVALYYHELYSLKQRMRFSPLFIVVAQSVAVASALLFGLYYLVPELSIGRGIFLINMILLPPLLTLPRELYMWLGRRKMLGHRVLIMGESGPAAEVYERLVDLPDYETVGCICTGGEALGNPVPSLGTPDELEEVVGRHHIDTLIVAMREHRGRLPLEDLLNIKLAGVQVDTQSTFLERATGRVPVEGLPPSTLIFSDGFRRIRMFEQIKIAQDRVLAVFLLLLLFPLLALISLAIRLDSPGPALYRQTRVGRAGKHFQIVKFRTMRIDAEADGARFAAEGDPRVTRVGRFLRKARLDELPQLLNVLRGEMSFVGPRPERPEFVMELQEKIPYYYLRTVVRPGITGWAQIRYPYGETIKEHREKLEHDLYYIKNISLTLDALIAFDTFRVVLFARGSR